MVLPSIVLDGAWLTELLWSPRYGVEPRSPENQSGALLLSYKGVEGFKPNSATDFKLKIYTRLTINLTRDAGDRYPLRHCVTDWLACCAPQPRRAASIAPTSIFRMVIIASKARFA